MHWLVGTTKESRWWLAKKDTGLNMSKIKKAAEFDQVAHIAADDIQSDTVNNDGIRSLVADSLAHKEAGDLVQIELPMKKMLHLEVVEPGLYSGHAKDEETGNILFNVHEQTLEQVLDNIIIRDPALSKPQVEEQAVEEIKVKEPKQISIVINIQKSIDDYINLVKGVRPKNFVSLKPKKTKEDKKIEDEQVKESLKSKGTTMDKEKLKKSVQKAYDDLPEWIDSEEDMLKANECLKTLKEEIGEDEGTKAFEMICKSKYDRTEDDLIAKSAEQMFEDKNGVLDFSDDSDVITERQRHMHDSIQSQLKKESKEEDPTEE